MSETTALADLRGAVADLPPNYFSMVMATGIVAIGSSLLGYRLPALVLFYLNVVMYLVLWAMTVGRILLFPRRLLADVADHQRGVGFFTVVAATAIVGGEFVLQAGMIRAGLGFFLFGFALWILVFYGVFTALIVRSRKPSMDTALNGTRLVSTVSTESLAVLAVLLAPHFPAARPALLFLALGLFLFGGMLYVLIMSMIFLRLMFLGVKPENLPATTWITMGACAVTVLAGGTLLIQGVDLPFFRSIEPFLAGSSLVFWATGTAWIPLLLLLGIWRHVVRRVRLSYGPEYWSLVFPLGMYTASTHQLGRATGLAFLLVIPAYFVFAAWSAWALTFAGLVANLLSTVCRRPKGAAS